ncbi:hypothetical protein GMOD_00006515 [Pyrenophora seminiperda CCB06]|uniref:Uncharacterized protein n=1 Tax=Pyrenophora seminiperda CCB06 TaxID=1302712 RepID=A0A3M7MA80_9PLEO|nr:hypothetical protein GMOD_00006515 [Pyrenophora seminiperda CCB06]
MCLLCVKYYNLNLNAASSLAQP